MGLPGRVIGEACLRLGRQAAEHRPGERAAAHVGQGRRVDHILAVAGAQQVEEVEPALARPRAEPGEGRSSPICWCGRPPTASMCQNEVV